MSTDTDTTSYRPPKPPAGLRTSGRKLWRAVVADLELRPDELEVLRQASRAADVSDDLAAALVDAPSTIEGYRGKAVANPAIAEWRATVSLVARLLAQLDIPEDNVAGDGRLTARQIAKRAADARWEKYRHGA